MTDRTNLDRMLAALTTAESAGHLHIQPSATRTDDEQRVFVAENLLVGVGLNDE